MKNKSMKEILVQLKTNYFSGNLNRGEFIKSFIVMLIVQTVLFMFCAYLVDIPSMMFGVKFGARQIAAAAIIALWIVFSIWVNIGTTAQRLNDMKWSRWAIAGFLVPIVNFIVLLAVIFVKGKIDNQVSFKPATVASS